MATRSSTDAHTEARPRVLSVKRRTAWTPADQAARQYRSQSVRGRLLNAAKTVAAVVMWIVVGSIQVGVIAPYVSYAYAQGMLSSLALSSAILLHLWPSRTPQWRTLFWTFWLTGGTGATLLLLGAGTMALTATTIVGFTFVALRVNQNGRKIVRLVRDWWTLR